MRVIYNRHFPLRGFWAINLCGLVFARKDYGPLSGQAVRHEYIHSLQQREMLFLFFFVWYAIEWLYRFCRYRNAQKAYRNISFEREAYACQGDAAYPAHRPFFAWMRYL